MKSLTPGQQVIKVVNEELTVTSVGSIAFDLGGARPAVVLMAGCSGGPGRRPRARSSRGT